MPPITGLALLVLVATVAHLTHPAIRASIRNLIVMDATPQMARDVSNLDRYDSVRPRS